MKKYATPEAELVLFAEDIVMASIESENSVYVDTLYIDGNGNVVEG